MLLENFILWWVSFLLLLSWMTFSPSVGLLLIISSITSMSVVVGAWKQMTFAILLLILTLLGGLFVIVSLIVLSLPWDYDLVSEKRMDLSIMGSFFLAPLLTYMSQEKGHAYWSVAVDLFCQDLQVFLPVFLLLLLLLFLFIFDSILKF